MKKYEKDDLWSPIATVNEPIYTPIQIHNLTGYHMHNVVSPPCEFCEWDWSARKLLKDGESNLEIIGDRLEIEHCEVDSTHKHYSLFQVNYCPMCGKRLEIDL